MAVSRKTLLIYEDTVDPTGSENFSAGYQIGDNWRNTTSGQVFTCTGDGTWKNITQIAVSGTLIKTGTYTGDGTTSQAITGIGFSPKYVKIWRRETVDNTGLVIFETTPDIIDDNAAGGAILHDGVLDHSFQTDKIISLDSDGFTVDDSGIDANPNQDTIVYNYMALG